MKRKNSKKGRKPKKKQRQQLKADQKVVNGKTKIETIQESKVQDKIKDVNGNQNKTIVIVQSTDQQAKNSQNGQCPLLLKQMQKVNQVIGKYLKPKGDQQVAKVAQSVRGLKKQNGQALKIYQSACQQAMLQKCKFQMNCYVQVSKRQKDQKRLKLSAKKAKNSQRFSSKESIHFQQQIKQEQKNNTNQMEEMRKKIRELTQKLQKAQTLVNKRQVLLKQEPAKKQLQNSCLKQQLSALQNGQIKKYQQEKLISKQLEEKVENLQEVKIEQQQQQNEKLEKIAKQTRIKISITPDTTTYVWKEQFYSQDGKNKNICIYQCDDGQRSSEWLCSAQDLPLDGEFVFTINALRVSKNYNEYGICSQINIGLMESQKKQKEWQDTRNHCVYLNLFYQRISRPNEEQTKYELIDCSCQPTLESLPSLIQCHVNRYSNTIAWHYNGKEQAKSNMPLSWKDGRNLCAVFCIRNQDDSVEFL